MPFDFVYLASASPRRRELLRQIGVAYQIVPVDVDERIGSHDGAPEPPHRYVSRLAAAKAEAGWRARPDGAPVLGADTAVVLDERIMGKPRDARDAADMLGALGGRTHRVLTAVALRSAGGLYAALSESAVTMRQVSAAEAHAYWQTREPWDKAGAYAIQGLGAVFIAALHGSFSGVMGLPLYETAQLLAQAGVKDWSGA